MSEKQRQKKAGARKDKKNRAMRQDVAARGGGATGGTRPKTNRGVAKSARPGRTKGKGGAASPTHKDFSAAELARIERPARGRQAR